MKRCRNKGNFWNSKSSCLKWFKQWRKSGSTYWYIFHDSELYPIGFQPIMPIYYSNKKSEPFDITDPNEDKLNLALFTKSKTWVKEDEYRVAISKEDVKDFSKQIFPVKKGVFQAVYMGWHLKTDHRKRIIQILTEKKRKGQNINLFQAKPKQGKFALYFEPVKL